MANLQMTELQSTQEFCPKSPCWESKHTIYASLYTLVSPLGQHQLKLKNIFSL